MDSSDSETRHILMFPWLAHGHISPYLELAKRLSKRNFVVHLCSTSANFKSIANTMSEKHAASIHLVELRLPTLFLNRSLHTTNGLPPELMPRLKKTLDQAAPELCRVLAALSPDLLVYDFLQPWAPLAAAAHGVPAVEFITSSATMMAYLFHFFAKPHAAFPFDEIYYRKYEEPHRDKLLQGNAMVRRNAFDGVDRSSDIVLIKGFREIESKYSDYLFDLLGKKVVAVGALVQEPSSVSHELEEDSTLIEWLDKKGKRSTIFVSFGSEYFLTREDMLELAHGLELSNFNFIWVVRFPKGKDVVLEDSLPLGFLARVGGRGLVVEGWAPQAKILGHESIGGFVSHCGCSSMMESMKFGVPIIAMPMHLDQPLNARLVEQIGVGVEVVRNDLGMLERKTVAAVIRRVVAEEGGEGVRRSARCMSEKLEAKGDQEIEEVVQEFVKLCKKKSTNGFH
ncbi:beta-D-glucosyl crocetin beta-1,6-glucosyltransferase-like [Salvia miltiorrhiza]|uniref:beta-D-glucosyl crocetin beta-1,6-glucosyltransferase-like n=1 Tax=Salvia miltiorrhiza TaxID=226208 RepID=UPI0025AB6549|nr:beta-D-glucosyl crocetin beta-1,6-glucosyltransferase-like [Salvia miltiorrhiza]